MAFAGDLKESKKLWSQSSSSFKFIVVVSTFFSVSAFASLSDIIFSWKGFIFDGVSFYNNWIVSPIQYVFTSLDVSVTNSIVNYIVLSLSLRITLIRVETINMEKFKAIKFSIFWLLDGLLALFLIVIMLHSMPNFMFVFLLILYFTIPFIYKLDIKKTISVYMPFLFSIVILLLLGAINSGLSRPLIQ